MSFKMARACNRHNRLWMDFSEKSRIVAALGERVESLDDGEHFFYFITINFNLRSNCYQKQIIKMHEQVKHIYYWILRDAERKFWSPARAQYVLLLIAFVDLPEARYNSYVTLGDHNEGFHVHCVLVVRRDTRKKDQWKAHIRKHMRRYYGQDGVIRKIHVLRIKRNIAKVLDYSAKLYKNPVWMTTAYWSCTRFPAKNQAMCGTTPVKRFHA